MSATASTSTLLYKCDPVMLATQFWYIKHKVTHMSNPSAKSVIEKEKEGSPPNSDFYSRATSIRNEISKLRADREKSSPQEEERGTSAYLIYFIAFFVFLTVTNMDGIRSIAVEYRQFWLLGTGII